MAGYSLDSSNRQQNVLWSDSLLKPQTEVDLPEELMKMAAGLEQHLPDAYERYKTIVSGLMQNEQLSN